MSVARTSKRRATAAAMTLREISAGASTQLSGDQSLHRANSESESQPEIVPPPVEPLPDTIPVDAGTPDLERKIGELLDQIGEGLRADDATNFEKLTIARKYGPLLWDLKSLAAHGEFMSKLKERFPKVNYAKCNRWMFIAKHDADVVAAIEAHPTVAWGPKKMIDYLKGFWNPEEEAEDDEEEARGYEGEKGVEQEPLLPDNNSAEDVEEPDAESLWVVGAMNPDLAAAADEAEAQQQASPHAAPPGSTAGPVVQAVPTPKGRKPPKPGRSSPGSIVTVSRTDYEVEVRLGFKLSVAEEVTADAIVEALRSIGSWTIGINTPFGYEMSEKGVAVNHVRPWDSAEQFEPEAV